MYRNPLPLLRSLAGLRTPNLCAADGDNTWNSARVEQGELSAAHFHNMRLLQRYFDVRKQGHG